MPFDCERDCPRVGRCASPSDPFRARAGGYSAFLVVVSDFCIARVRRWPFVTGFALTGFLILKVSSGITEEQLKASKFSNSKAAHH
ncbi:MAG: hypothetical protein ABGY24_10240 [bacterium]|jgi:hypothetical protein